MSSISVTKHNAKDTFGCPFCVGWGTEYFESRSASLAKRNGVRFRRLEIGVLAHQAQSARIFAAGEYPVPQTAEAYLQTNAPPYKCGQSRTPVPTDFVCDSPP